MRISRLRRDTIEINGTANMDALVTGSCGGHCAFLFTRGTLGTTSLLTPLCVSYKLLVTDRWHVLVIIGADTQQVVWL